MGDSPSSVTACGSGAQAPGWDSIAYRQIEIPALPPTGCVIPGKWQTSVPWCPSVNGSNNKTYDSGDQYSEAPAWH